MKIAICDDQREYINEIYSYVKDYFDTIKTDSEIFSYTSGDALLEAGLIFDIVFIDIEMPGLSGLKVSEKINSISRKTLIFIVTSHEKYLDDAMDLNVFRYIDKPINKERLFRSLGKAMEILNNSVIAFKSDKNEYISLDKQDIICAEIRGRKVYISSTGGNFITNEKMSFFKKNLNASYFIIPHNSYIVNMKFVKIFSREELTLKNNYKIPVAYRKQNEVKKKFINYMGEEYDILSGNI